MDKQEPGTTPQHTEAASQRDARSLSIADRGIRTGADFAGMMSALMGDLISGRITPQVGNAVCNAGGKLLRVVELQYKFGTKNGEQSNRVLQLVPPETAGE